MVHLLLPTWCPGCGHAGVPLCLQCARSFSHWFRAETDADALPPGLPVWAAAAYAKEAARVVMAWKSGQRPDLAGPIHRLGFRLGANLGSELRPGPGILVIPAPSGWRRRWGGKEVVAPLASEVAHGLASSGHSARVVPALRRRGGNRHHLSKEQRRAERAAAISLRPRARGWRGMRGRGRNGRELVLLVDDVLTTGATLGASAAAASQLGPVVGAIVLAATPKPVYRD